VSIVFLMYRYDPFILLRPTSTLSTSTKCHYQLSLLPSSASADAPYLTATMTSRNERTPLINPPPVHKNLKDEDDSPMSPGDFKLLMSSFGRPMPR
jgi:hypothetical protein